MASNSPEMKGTMESLVMIAQKQGWKQLFSGLSINYLKVANLVILFSFHRNITLLSCSESDDFTFVANLANHM